MEAAELAASQSLAAETAERAELRDVSVLSSSAILCTNLSKSIALRCADNVQRENELINLLVRYPTRLRYAHLHNVHSCDLYDLCRPYSSY